MISQFWDGCNVTLGMKMEHKGTLLKGSFKFLV